MPKETADVRMGKFIASLFAWHLIAITSMFAVFMFKVRLPYSTSLNNQLWEASNGDVLYFALDAIRTVPTDQLAGPIFLLATLLVFACSMGYFVATWTLTPLVYATNFGKPVQ